MRSSIVQCRLKQLCFFALMSASVGTMAQNDNQPSGPQLSDYIQKFSGKVNPEKVPFSAKIGTFLLSYSNTGLFSSDDAEKILAHKENFLREELAIYSSANERTALVCAAASTASFDSLVNGGAAEAARNLRLIEEDVESEFVAYHSGLLNSMSPEGRDQLLTQLENFAASSAVASIDWDAYARDYPEEMANMWLASVCRPRLSSLTLQQVPSEAVGGPPQIGRIGTVLNTDSTEEGK